MQVGKVGEGSQRIPKLDWNSNHSQVAIVFSGRPLAWAGSINNGKEPRDAKRCQDGSAVERYRDMS